MASVYVVRHGQASFGTDNYDRLSELGCRQAEVLGHYFDSRGLRFDAVYTGNLERQRKTAEIAVGSHGREHRVDAPDLVADFPADLEELERTVLHIHLLIDCRASSSC